MKIFLYYPRALRDENKLSSIFPEPADSRLRDHPRRLVSGGGVVWCEINEEGWNIIIGKSDDVRMREVIM